MTEFCINSVSKSKLADEGISVKELLELLDVNDELNKALLKALGIDRLKDDFINIAGAKDLVTIQKAINKRFYKEDFVSSLDNISVYSNDSKLAFCFTDLVKVNIFRS